jgi:hypothetical protein
LPPDKNGFQHLHFDRRELAVHGGRNLYPRKDRATGIPNTGPLPTLGAPRKHERGRHRSWRHGQTRPTRSPVAAGVGSR